MHGANPNSCQWEVAFIIDLPVEFLGVPTRCPVVLNNGLCVLEVEVNG